MNIPIIMQILDDHHQGFNNNDVQKGRKSATLSKSITGLKAKTSLTINEDNKGRTFQGIMNLVDPLTKEFDPIQNPQEKAPFNSVIRFFKINFETHNFLTIVNTLVESLKNIKKVINYVSVRDKTKLLFYENFVDNPFKPRNQHFIPYLIGLHCTNSVGLFPLGIRVITPSKIEKGHLFPTTMYQIRPIKLL